MKQSRAPFEADYRLNSGGDRGISALDARMYFDRGNNNNQRQADTADYVQFSSNTTE